jgi:hypothetical protein
MIDILEEGISFEKSLHSHASILKYQACHFAFFKRFFLFSRQNLLFSFNPFLLQSLLKKVFSLDLLNNLIVPGAEGGGYDSERHSRATLLVKNVLVITNHFFY